MFMKWLRGPIKKPINKPLYLFTRIKSKVLDSESTMSHEQNSVNFIQNKCDSVLRCISDSSLNYVIQSTPYSIYITIRKSLSKWNLNLDNKSIQSAQNDSFQSGKSDHQLQALQKRNTFLEDANETLRGDLE